jgi:hypothetical protein
MKEAKRLLIVLFLGVFLVMSTGFSPAHACSCAGATPEQAFQRAEAVFTGTVISISPPLVGIISNSASPETVTFRVSNVSKGPPPSTHGTIVLTTAVSGASCGYPFQNGGQYMVYAFNSGQQLQTDLCSGTKLLSAAPLSTLQGDIPQQDNATNSQDNQGPFYTLVIVAVAAVLAGGVAIFSVTSRRVPR